MKKKDPRPGKEIANVSEVKASEAEKIMRGLMVGVILFTQSFSLTGCLPCKFMPMGKVVTLSFFPGLESTILAASSRVKTAIKNIAIHIGDGDYIPMSMWGPLCKVCANAEQSVQDLILESLIPLHSQLRADYLERVQTALEREGVSGHNFDEAYKIMEGKFPSKFDFKLTLSAYSFPVSTVPRDAPKDLKVAMAEGDASRIAEAFQSLIGNAYQKLYESAVKIANSMEKNSKTGNRTLGLVSKTISSVKCFMSELCEDRGMKLTSLSEALDTFQKIFVDEIDNSSPTTARCYAAIVWNAARELGVDGAMNPMDIDMSAEALSAFGMTFSDS